MVQLEVLSGKKAGTAWLARRFPVRIGRSPAAHLRLEEDGVWDKHLELRFDTSKGFVMSVQSRAVATVNNQPVQQALLRNGDSVEIGSARLRFWLSPARQSRLWTRETIAWLALAGVTGLQIAAMNWLSR